MGHYISHRLEKVNDIVDLVLFLEGGTLNIEVYIPHDIHMKLKGTI